MPTLIQLPGDHTALLKDSDELSNRASKEIRHAARKVAGIGQKLKDLGFEDIQKVSEREDATEDEKKDANAKALAMMATLSDEEADQLDLYQRACAVVRLIEWSLPQPIPATVDDVDDLPLPIYKALTTEAAKLDLNESFDKDSGLLDPKADTEDSESSKQPLEEDLL